MTPEKAYEEIVRLSRETALLASCHSLLQWDAEICMPRVGVTHRGEQMALLAGLAHDRATDPRWAELLATVEESSLAKDPEGAEAVNVRERRRDYDRETKVPRRLVEEIARVHAMSAQAWSEARDNDDFASFAPWLERTFELAGEKADAYGYSGERYDALLDEFEPGMTAGELTVLLEQLRVQLVPLVESLRDKWAARANGAREFPLELQRAFAEGVAAELGFDVAGGRFDLGPHPFCTFIGPGDVRIALRYHTHDFASGFLAVLHETGHALYEQGLDPSHYGTPMGEAISLGIHESQSRMWENLVGRSRGFWQHYYPELQRVFPDALGSVSANAFRGEMNVVSPGFVRVEADEVTYNLHIIIRFELERALLSGNLTARDVPAAWRELYEKYLGITPESDREGCLQDIHWSEGLIGYFPTYTLGNMYAAQLFDAADRQIGSLEEQFARGEFSQLREWLRENIHRHGKRYHATELIQRVAGGALDPSALVHSLVDRYST